MPTPARHPDALSDTHSIEDARDAQLFERARKGEAAAWTEFVHRYQDRLFAVCLRIVHDREMAADLTQDSFVKIIKGVEKYDGRSKLSTWLIRITMNVCLSKLRAEKLRRHASLDAPGGGSGGAEDGENDQGLGSRIRQYRELSALESVERDEEQGLLLAALRRLDDEQRTILLLRDGHGLEYDQIAEMLGIAVGTVKSRLFRARAALRSEVEGARGG